MVLLAVGSFLCKHISCSLQQPGIVWGEYYPDLILTRFLVRFA